MKRIQWLFVLLLSLSLLFSVSFVSFAKSSVKGYFKKDGTYVAPHYRSSPNNNFYDNWSTKGNYNPYTGKKGTKTYRYK